MRSLIIKIYLYFLYFFYILPKALINFILGKDVLKIKLGEYDSLLDDYTENFNVDSGKGNKKIQKRKNFKKHLTTNILFGELR